MQFHPIANIFPLLEGEEFDALVADIKDNGLQNPITVHENKILDGRNRFRACQKLGIEPFLKTLNGQDPFVFVVTENLMRRHLSPTQRAVAAAEIANMKHGGDRTSEQAANLRDAQKTQAEAAKMFGVSERSVSAAAFVKKNGSVQEIELVRSGKKKLGRVVENIKQRKIRTAKRDAGELSPRANAVAIQKFADAVSLIWNLGETFKNLRIPKLDEQTALEAVDQLNQVRRELARVVRELTAGKEETNEHV